MRRPIRKEHSSGGRRSSLMSPQPQALSEFYYTTSTVIVVTTFCKAVFLFWSFGYFVGVSFSPRPGTIQREPHGRNIHRIDSRKRTQEPSDVMQAFHSVPC